MTLHCLVTHLTRNHQGLAASNETRIAAERIELGRGAACPIHLPDHRVALLHATLERDANGDIRIEAAANAMLSIDGFVETSARLQAGMQIGIGPYRLTVLSVLPVPDSPGADELVLSVDRPEEAAGPPASSNAAPVTLAALGIRKRWLGLGLAGALLLGLLLLPLLTRISPDFEAWQAGLPVSLTGLLNPGDLSAGHRMFGLQCSRCHQAALVAVSNEACTDCHTTMQTHLNKDHRQHQRTAAHACIDCHPAHDGKARAQPGSTPTCIACHGTTGNRNDAPGVAGAADGSAQAAAIHDFSRSHPAFHLDIPAGRQTRRVAQDGTPLPPEQSGLKFSHAVHLVKEGVSSPLGNTVLACTDCHRLQDSGAQFEAIDMEQTCQQSRCHKLRLDQPVYAVVPHGSPHAALAKLRSHYAAWLAEDPRRLSECKDLPGNALTRAIECSEHLARRQAAETLFRDRGENSECALCHEITTTDNTAFPWKIAPVRKRHDWQPGAVFNHARHGTLACTECHDKASSKSAADVAFPTIKECRHCHDDAGAAATRVTARCESCHRYHRHPLVPE